MSDNLISRQDAIDAIRASASKYTGFMEMEMYTDDDAVEAINGVPSAHPGPQWVPCSERLPEEDVEVLISYRYKEGEGDTSHVNVDITSYGQMYFGGREVAGEKHWRPPFEYFSSNYEVIAWMPLPEPWKGARMKDHADAD